LQRLRRCRLDDHSRGRSVWLRSTCKRCCGGSPTRWWRRVPLAACCPLVEPATPFGITSDAGWRIHPGPLAAEEDISFPGLRDPGRTHRGPEHPDVGHCSGLRHPCLPILPESRMVCCMLWSRFDPGRGTFISTGCELSCASSACCRAACITSRCISRYHPLNGSP